MSIPPTSHPVSQPVPHPVSQATPPLTTRPGPTPRFNETAVAIGGALLISLVLGTLVSGNPFKAMVMAYTDYSNTPAAGAPHASTTRAPETKDQVLQQDKASK